MAILFGAVFAVLFLQVHQHQAVARVFCATRSSNVDAAPYVDFDALTLEEGPEPSGFDLASDTFSPPVDGLYWLTWSVGLPTGTTTDVLLNGIPGRFPALSRQAYGPAEASSRVELAQLTAGVDTLHLSSTSPLYSDNATVYTSWSGFHLDSIMQEPVVAFAVGRSTSQMSSGLISMDLIHVDTHNAFAGARYTIPVSGLWVITMQIGDYSGYTTGYTYLRFSSGEIFAVFHQWHGYGIDQESVTIVAPANAGTTVYAELMQSSTDSAVYSDAGYQTSLMGFLYNPVAQPVAWFVWLPWLIEFADPVPFDKVLTNEGNGYNTATDVFTAPLAGVYYVSISGIPYVYGPMKLELLLNGVERASVYSALDGNGFRTRNRAIILRLNVNDQLHVRVPVGHSAYGHDLVYVTFSGFRISA